jgi:5-methylcytosine-specific restriction endonuclease McrA
VVFNMASKYVPYSGSVVTRAEAKAASVKFYFSGSSCPFGHLSQRRTINGSCLACEAAPARRASAVKKTAKWRTNKPDIREYRATEARNRRAKDPVKARANDAIQRASLNKVQRAAVMRAWRRKRRDEIRAYDEKWKAENPDSFREKCRRRQARRRARKRGAEGAFTAADIERLFVAQSGVCAGCEAPLGERFEIDHKTPLSREGSNWPENLQLLCRSCNAQKGAMTMDEWAARRCSAAA